MGGGGGILDQTNAFHAHIFFVFELGVVRFSFSELLKLQCFGQKPQKKAPNSFFRSETLPSSVT